MKDLFGKEAMKALSWREPFGSLMLHGKIETRTWETSYRGLVLICTSKKPYTEYDMMGLCGEVITQGTLVYMLKNGIKEISGQAIAVGRLIDCRNMKKEDEAKCFVKYNPDLWCHIYEDVKAIKPFAWKGSLGWRNVEQQVIDRIEFI